MAVIRLLLLLCVLFPNPSQPTSSTSDPTKMCGPIELDLSPLPRLESGRYKLRIKATAGKDVYSEAFNIDAREEHQGIRDLVKTSLESAGWRVIVVAENKLGIIGTASGSLQKFNAEVEGLPKRNTPTFRSLPRKVSE